MKSANMQIFILFHIMYIETSLSNHSKGKETLYLSNPEARFFVWVDVLYTRPRQLEAYP